MREFCEIYGILQEAVTCSILHDQRNMTEDLLDSSVMFAYGFRFTPGMRFAQRLFFIESMKMDGFSERLTDVFCSVRTRRCAKKGDFGGAR